MEDAAAATFRPTWQQALGRGLYLGSLAAIGVLIVTAVLTSPGLVWVAALAGPTAAGGLIGVFMGRFTGTQISARGIRTVSVFNGGIATWNEVVDLRAERRGGRTVVSVYLDSGASVQLQAPYSGGLFAADPKFEGKMFALSHLWRSHRFGGLSG
ncbi:hypothetical protein [Paractinoplanes hotanensis]|uniref:PH domain-containing protein n=1 Tax=Paractinoplanes hotanensis TaxID=2906497 RepID=A0ABT0YB18_9ACTN|nr:hypothetical protein [Actinoplanes hotanensis]MCM4083244.1 hypothetical protein [Actinoplanes hotanensis]